MPTIEFSKHALEQMIERGATEAEVRLAIEQGDTEPAREGRTMHRKNIDFGADWRGRHYRSKQVAPVVAKDGDKLIIVTVYVFYF
jgi:Domain of unknown function (DUF4258)